MNLLPVEYRKKPMSDWTALFFILSLGAASVFYPLNMWQADQDLQFMRMKTELLTKQQGAKQITALETQVKELSTTLTQTSKKADGLQQDYQVLSERTTSWSRIVTEIDKETTAYKIVLQSLEQQISRVVAKGYAADYSAAVNFATSLSISGLFSTVSFQQIALENIPQPSPATVPPGTKSPPPPSPRPVYAFTIVLEVKPGGGR